MSRLNMARLLDSKNHRKDLSGIGEKAAQVCCKGEEQGVPGQGVLGDLNGKVQCAVLAD